MVTVLTGSGVAAFTSLAHVIPDVAQHLNSNGIAIMLMMHTASEMLRALSPVAGVIIIVAGFAKKGQSVCDYQENRDPLCRRLHHDADYCFRHLLIG